MAEVKAVLLFYPHRPDRNGVSYSEELLESLAEDRDGWEWDAENKVLRISLSEQELNDAMKNRRTKGNGKA